MNLSLFAKPMSRSFAVLAVLLMVGCASGGRVVDEWRADGHSDQFKKVLLLTISYGGPFQEVAEDELITQLRANGVDVVRRSDLFRASEELNAEKVRAKLAGTDIGAVLLVSVGQVGTSGRGEPGLLSAPRGGYGDYETELSYVLSMGGRRPGDYRTDNVQADVISKLYAVSTAQPVWSVVIRTDNPGSPAQLIKTASKRIVRSLKGSGMINKPKPSKAVPDRTGSRL
jgi:hypothetical protein